MDTNTLHKKYLQQGTAGFAIIRKFHSRYADLLAKNSVMSIDDVLHEIFLSLSKSDLTDVRNVEHYIMRAIKLQCWSLLDKAIRQKTVGEVCAVTGDEKEEPGEQVQHIADQNNQLTELEGMDLLVQINLFKARLNPHEVRLLNYLIDETERADIATFLEMNLNTLDTNIRRLRIKLAEYLKNLGYLHSGMERFG
ncbi:MAG: sigma-70 family RNA polymerase sigma factor [Ignavibacteriales bacterium]|nr:sigma-70 family RNA polymerase sigma factor [Ignavibacteriales bacterium]